MREIKFRGKRIENGEWVYGYYAYIGHTGKEKYYIIPSYASAFYGIEIDPATVGQYTGLSCNGTDLYEGDICFDVYLEEYFIVWWDDEGRWVAKFETNVVLLSDAIDVDTDIRGNVWDNPELLEDANGES